MSATGTQQPFERELTAYRYGSIIDGVDLKKAGKHGTIYNN